MINNDCSVLLFAILECVSFIVIYHYYFGSMIYDYRSLESDVLSRIESLISGFR